MLRPIGDIVRHSEEITALCAATRSARNLAAREREADREAKALSTMTRLKRLREDRELEKRLRFRIRVEQHERPRISDKTARNLFHRAGKTLDRFEGFRPVQAPASVVQSLYVQWKSRGLKSRSGRAWRSGEAGRFARYIMREDALEAGELGWMSNIGDDRTEVTAFWRALEQVERLNRENANVYLSIIIPLPYELTEKQRIGLAEAITRPLETRGIPFVAGRPVSRRHNATCVSALLISIGSTITGEPTLYAGLRLCADGKIVDHGCLRFWRGETDELWLLTDPDEREPDPVCFRLIATGPVMDEPPWRNDAELQAGLASACALVP